jgi:hypothetical protein
MKKLLILAIFANIIAPPAFGQSFAHDFGTGNVNPPVANMGAASVYAQAPAIYDHGYVQHRNGYRFGVPPMIDRDNTSVPGQGVDKDDTIPRLR